MFGQIYKQFNLVKAKARYMKKKKFNVNTNFKKFKLTIALNIMTNNVFLILYCWSSMLIWAHEKVTKANIECIKFIYNLNKKLLLFLSLYM